MQTLRAIEALISARRFDQAVAAWQTCIASDAPIAESWFRLGQLGVQLGQPAAIDCLRKATEQSRDAAPAVLLAQQLLVGGDKIAALGAARVALERDPRDTVELVQLGTVLAHCDAGELALTLFERAAGQAPANPQILFNLATAQRANGLIAEAEKTIDATLRLRPDDAEAHYFRSGLRRQRDNDNHVDAMRATLARRRAPPGPADAPIHFALGKELEDIGRYDEAFAHFGEGNRLRRAAFRYDVRADVATIDALIAHHDRDALDAVGGLAGDDAMAPIFIVGLPRSGTTLVERILAAHPDVTAGGELDAFPRAIVSAVGVAGLTKEQFVTRSLTVDPAALGRAYLDQVGERRGTTARFTDKLPINALYIGFISRALPEARIVLLQRDTIANAVAMFTTLFGDAYPFSYAIDELATYMRAWQRLMAHWKAVLGPRILTLRYEDLVSGPEPQVRELLGHCGLQWDPSCLDFHRTSGSVSSASAVQVRRPFYTDSVAKWKGYGARLDRLRALLG